MEPEPSDRELLRRVRSWQKVPPLRMDLRFVRSREPGLFRLCDPATQKFVELYELECLVAQAMDGQRSSEDLTSFARMYNPAITHAQVELLLVQLLHLRLLDEPVKPGHGKLIQLPIPKAPVDEFSSFRNELVLDLQRNEALTWSEATSPVPRTPLFEAARRPSRVVYVSNDVVFDDLDSTNINGEDELDDEQLDRTNLTMGADPFEVLEQNRDRMVAAGETFDSTYLAHSEARGEPEPQPEAEPPPRPSISPRQAEAEQEGLFEQSQAKKRRWYQRKSVRILFVLGVLIGVAALIYRPLYVTSECAIIPTQRVYVRSPIAGVIAEILVDEGSVVKKGDVIARLDDRHLAADRRKALAEVERIDAELQRLRRGARPEEIKQARAVLGAKGSAVAFAAKEARRRARMVQEGVGSRASLDEAQGDLAVKQNAYSEAAAALRLLESGSRPEEVSALEAVHKRAKAELEFIDQKLADMVVIRSPMDGVLLTPKFRERLHENLEAGGLVCEIADMRTVRAEIFVAEREVDSIEVGMPVVVKVESYPRHPFNGKVDFIAPAVEVRDKIKVVRVVATLDNQEGLLRRDMTGYGEVECGNKSLLDLATRRILRWVRVRFLI